MAQRHRIALLALLATAPRHLLPRDRLLGLLWPEMRPESARHLLNTSVHEIRKALGHEVLLSEGEGLRLARQQLRVDVLEFGEARERGDLLAAIEFYTGPFLDGLAIPDAVEFEHWADRERTRLEELYHDVLDEAAEAAGRRGNVTESLRWWRQRLACTPADGRIVLHVMRCLAETGDRAGALKVAAAHAALLHDEFGVAADPDVAAFAAELHETGQPPRQMDPVARATAPAVTPAITGTSVASPEPAVGQRPETPRRSRRPTALWLGGLASTAILTVVLLWPSSTPRVTGYTQLTSSRLLFPPAVSPFPMATEGSHIYFTEFINLKFQLRQVSRAGGDALPLAPLGPGRAIELMAITTDNSHLAFGEFLGGTRSLESPIWLWPVVGGPARRLGEAEGHSVAWSPDGDRVVYMHANDIHIARADGSGSRKLLSAPGRPYWPAFSPDGRRLRFTVFDLAKRVLPTLWEASADGEDLHPLLPGWNDPPNECCGSWTPDGEYYVFQATRADGTHLWALRDDRGRFSSRRPEPVQLTSGPMNFIRPLVASDGRLFAIGWQLHGELAQYDAQSGRFEAHRAALSAEWLAYSRDGHRITYVTYPEVQLWRSTADGGERLQLTFSPMRARRPQWSPDARTIAFEGQVGERPWKIYLISTDGGAPRELTMADRAEAFPTWSADGRFLAFALEDAGSVVGGEGIRILDLESGNESGLKDSDGLRGPSWSPDGRYLAAASRDRQTLLLFDFAAGQWKELARVKPALGQYWSADAQYLHFHTMPPDIEFYRVRMRDGAVQQLGALEDVRWVWGIAWPWMGITPEGSPLFLRDHSIHHLYALDWKR